jgi:hypothetical protein
MAKISALKMMAANQRRSAPRLLLSRPGGCGT